MFILLLVVALMVSFVVCFILARLFRPPINRILQRLVGEDIYTAWTRYLTFALYVVGVSGGIRIWQMDRYLSPRTKEETILELTGDRWTLELFATVMGTLQSVAWMLLVFFLVALLAFVVVKGRETKRQTKDE